MMNHKHLFYFWKVAKAGSVARAAEAIAITPQTLSGQIGLLGLNGSGKSSLIRIMAGVDKDIEGEAIPMPGIRIGYLPQEPQLDPAHTVRQAVEAGLGEIVAAKTRLDEIYAAYAEPDADFDKLAKEKSIDTQSGKAGGEQRQHRRELSGVVPEHEHGIRRAHVLERRRDRVDAMDGDPGPAEPLFDQAPPLGLADWERWFSDPRNRIG